MSQCPADKINCRASVRYSTCGSCCNLLTDWSTGAWHWMYKIFLHKHLFLCSVPRPFGLRADPHDAMRVWMVAFFNAVLYAQFHSRLLQLNILIVWDPKGQTLSAIVDFRCYSQGNLSPQRCGKFFRWMPAYKVLGWVLDTLLVQGSLAFIIILELWKLNTSVALLTIQ